MSLLYLYSGQVNQANLQGRQLLSFRAALLRISVVFVQRTMSDWNILCCWTVMKDRGGMRTTRIIALPKKEKHVVWKAVEVCSAGAKWKINTLATYDCNSSWPELGSSKNTWVSSLQSDSMQNKNNKVHSRNCNCVVLDGMKKKNKKQTYAVAGCPPEICRLDWLKR